LVWLAQATEISQDPICKGKNKRKINLRFIIGVIKAFSRDKPDDIFYDLAGHY